MHQSEPVCTCWDASECEGTVHCPPRCPRFVDRRGTAWIVRPADESDRGALVEMYDDFASEDVTQGLPPRTRRRIERWLDGLFADGCNFVASRHGTVAAHAVYTPTDEPEPEFAVFVHQRYQGRGLGTEVSKHAIATAAAADRTALGLLVAADNRRAKRLYRRLGFQVEDRPSFEGDGHSVEPIAMRRPLDERPVEYQHPPVARPERSP